MYITETGNPYQNVIRDYYPAHLDEEIGQVLELPTEDTVILVVSDHPDAQARRRFLRQRVADPRRAPLVLNQYPEKITPFSKLDVNWDKTRVWSEGVTRPRLLQRQGREPKGVIELHQYERFRDEIKARF